MIPQLKNAAKVFIIMVKIKSEDKNNWIRIVQNKILDK